MNTKNYFRMHAYVWMVAGVYTSEFCGNFYFNS